MLLPKLSAQSTGNKKGVVAFTPNTVSRPKKNLTPFCKYTQNSLPFPEPLDGPHWRLLSFSLDPQKLSFAALGSSSTSAMWGSLQTPDGPHQPPFLGNHFRGRGIPAGKSRGNTSGCASGTEGKTLGKAALLQRVTIWDHDQACSNVSRLLAELCRHAAWKGNPPHGHSICLTATSPRQSTLISPTDQPWASNFPSHSLQPACIWGVPVLLPGDAAAFHVATAERQWGGGQPLWFIPKALPGLTVLLMAMQHAPKTSYMSTCSQQRFSRGENEFLSVHECNEGVKKPSFSHLGMSIARKHWFLTRDLRITSFSFHCSCPSPPTI